MQLRLRLVVAVGLAASSARTAEAQPGAVVLRNAATAPVRECAALTELHEVRCCLGPVGGCTMAVLDPSGTPTSTTPPPIPEGSEVCYQLSRPEDCSGCCIFDAANRGYSCVDDGSFDAQTCPAGGGEWAGGAGPFAVTTIDQATAMCAALTDAATGTPGRVCDVEEIQGSCGVPCADCADRGLCSVWSSESCQLSALTIRDTPGRTAMDTECRPTAATAAVRCCSDSSAPGFAQAASGCSVWAASTLTADVSTLQASGIQILANGCTNEATFEEAVQTCEANGARLCTAAEVNSDCSTNTGCGHNDRSIWTSDDCGCGTTQDYHETTQTGIDYRYYLAILLGSTFCINIHSDRLLAIL